jgi:hypothetical protein
MRIFLHPLLRHKIRAHPFGCVAITCKLRIPILLCQAAMIFVSGMQERGGGDWGRGERGREKRMLLAILTNKYAIYATENGYFVSGLAEMQSYLNDL